MIGMLRWQYWKINKWFTMWWNWLKRCHHDATAPLNKEFFFLQMNPKNELKNGSERNLKPISLHQVSNRVWKTLSLSDHSLVIWTPGYSGIKRNEITDELALTTPMGPEPILSIPKSKTGAEAEKKHMKFITYWID